MYSFTKLFSQNLEIPAPCFVVIFSKCDVKEGPPFHTFLQIFYKNLKVLVL